MRTFFYIGNFDSYHQRMKTLETRDSFPSNPSILYTCFLWLVIEISHNEHDCVWFTIYEYRFCSRGILVKYNGVQLMNRHHVITVKLLLENHTRLRTSYTNQK